MRATVGISAEQAVVRGVMLESTARRGSRPAVLREVERPVGHSTAASVAATLDALTAETESGTEMMTSPWRTAPWPSGEQSFRNYRR
ncbi:hypothetical protein ACRS6B_21810 [Nocardia asteroides]